jgi:hypothetical protein
MYIPNRERNKKIDYANKPQIHVSNTSLFRPVDNQEELSLEIQLALIYSRSSPLKIQTLLSFQMHQHMTMIISIANGSFSILFICLVALSGFSQVRTLTPIIL